jgi:hypothetical protein
LKNEVLTYTLGKKKISRITLGALDDLGYAVNYTAADPYGLADIGVCTGCNIGKRRHLKGNDDMKLAAAKTSRCHSGMVHDRALRHGRKVLRDVHTHHASQSKRVPDGVTFVGNRQITVAYKHEDGTLCSVVVPGDDLFQ